MDYVKIALVMLCVFFGISVNSSAQNFGKAEENAKSGISDFERVQVARVSIVPDAAWRCGKAFDPPVLEIKVGTTVEWINLDRETHSVISSTGNEPCYLKADPRGKRFIGASQLPYKSTYKKRFDTPGEYHYSCHLPSHHMAGKIIVIP